MCVCVFIGRAHACVNVAGESIGASNRLRWHDQNSDQFCHEMSFEKSPRTVPHIVKNNTRYIFSSPLPHFTYAPCCYWLAHSRCSSLGWNRAVFFVLYKWRIICFSGNKCLLHCVNWCKWFRGRNGDHDNNNSWFLKNIKMCTLFLHVFVVHTSRIFEKK